MNKNVFNVLKITAGKCDLFIALGKLPFGGQRTGHDWFFTY